MDNIVTLLILGIPVAGLAWFAWSCTGPFQRRKKSAALAKLRSSKRYRGITIRNAGCKAVRRFSGGFYTLDNVPELPVEGCKALRCSCVYAGLNNRRYRDRRSGHDLRSVVRFDSEHPDRRHPQDRRKSSNIKWHDPAD